ncbi:transposase, IS605 OrfB family [Methanocaldococcus vulcanius M7]|uniref:Transposase, IS605 OrfB family n=1 Tax=Methanocaldococcus vulcanius (strain ATCC 700851 / DSM 12094 / M7) TaxID=579137 RepID=C9REB5_METVM|nr:RNA-guided endonuclease TnpB family protein [Methanocaldococcus vulcanius]ACX71917.1 transposase, IS605 OrfB family [Methanocaldococcus vulcanius M7]
MSKLEVTRVLTINLTRKLTDEQRIILNHLTYSASKLWNVANYEIIQDNIKLSELEKKLKDNFWYKNLHSQSAQAVLQKLKVAWDNFFKQHTKRPRFQPKDGHFPVKWKKDGFKIIANKLRLSLSKQTRQYLKERHGIESKFLWVELSKALPLDAMQVKEVEIVPHDIYGERFYVLHLIYKKEVNPEMSKEDKVIMAIDLGVRNLATVVIEGEKQPLIFDGKILVSKLRWFAKETARIKSIIAEQGLKTCKRLARLTVKERNYVKDYVHKISSWIIDLAKRKGVSRIIIGELNKNITKIDIGDRVNQQLHRIPYGKLVKMIEYKAEELGIKVEQIDESYTSQKCSVCGVIKKSNRKYRGLYICSNCGAVINADVNGARNILFKVVPNPERGRDSGLGNPRRVSFKALLS